jgi:hypothetical protein
MNTTKRAETAERKRSIGDFGRLADAPAGIALLWRSRTGGEITAEEARQAIENVSGFFSRLALWENAEK